MFKLIFRLTVPAAMMTVAAAPVTAQSFEELDSLAEQTTDEERGIAAAREQTERGELLQALATLERVLTIFPESAQARFNHAVLLCWIDDPQGGLVELARLDEDDYAQGVLEQAIADCTTATREEEQ